MPAPLTPMIVPSRATSPCAIFTMACATPSAPSGTGNLSMYFSRVTPASAAYASAAFVPSSVPVSSCFGTTADESDAQPGRVGRALQVAGQEHLRPLGARRSRPTAASRPGPRRSTRGSPGCPGAAACGARSARSGSSSSRRCSRARRSSPRSARARAPVARARPALTTTRSGSTSRIRRSIAGPSVASSALTLTAPGPVASWRTRSSGAAWRPTARTRAPAAASASTVERPDARPAANHHCRFESMMPSCVPPMRRRSGTRKRCAGGAAALSFLRCARRTSALIAGAGSDDTPVVDRVGRWLGIFGGAVRRGRACTRARRRRRR